MSDPLENGIILYRPEYSKKLLLAKCDELGLPSMLISDKLNLLIDRLYADGLVIGKTYGDDNRARNQESFRIDKNVELPVNYGRKKQEGSV